MSTNEKNRVYFIQIDSSHLRAHGLLFGAVILATFQAGLALSTTRQLLREEQEEIDSHFRRLSGALLEQERFMHRWSSHARMPAADPPANQPTSNAPHTTPPGRAGMASAGLGSVETDIPFSMLRTEGNLPPATAISLGTQFFNFYAAYWSASHYPSPRCLLVDGQGTAGLLVPLTVDKLAPRDASKGALTDALGYIHGVAKTLRRGEQHWYPYAMGDGSVQLASIAQAPWDAELWSDASDVRAPALACLLDVNRIDDHEQALGEPIYDQLSIIDQSGRLIHGPDTSLVDTRTRAFTTAGVIYRMRSDDGLKGTYQVGWSRILGQPGALLIGSILVALLLVLGGLLVLLGYRRSKVEPLRAHHEWLFESQAFSQTVLDAAPVGLCLLRHNDDAVILENALARSWLGEHHAAPGWQDAWRDIAPPGSHPGQPPTWSYDTPEGRHQLVAATEARYRGEPATLYLFIDLTLQHETDLLQRQAREAADQANRAKSLFLTTMNHTVAGWINPFFHLIKKEIKAIHEFLADRFAVTENTKWQYAELLLMQALNTNQRLVNPFFHNQIKRRIAMITTSKKTSHQYLRKMMVLPLTAFAVILFAFSYKNKKETPLVDHSNGPVTVVIDAGHGGADKGAIAADGTAEKDIALAIAQKIKALNEDENIKIVLTRDADILPELRTRTDFGNQQGPTLFLSLHVNSSPNKSKTGFEVVIPSKTKNFSSENKILASILLGYLVSDGMESFNKSSLSSFQ